MKRLYTGKIILDPIDIILISFSVGSSTAYFIRKYKSYKNKVARGVDPLVTELKEKSPVIAIGVDGKPLKLPLVRGGDEKLKGLFILSVVIKNQKLANLLRSIIEAKKEQKQLRLVRMFFFVFNGLLTSSVGLHFTMGGSLDYSQILLLVFPSTIAGFLIEQAIANPLATIFLPVAILYGRGIEYIPGPYENCQALCKVAEEFHNKQLAIEMKELNSLVEDTSTALQLPLDEVPLLCVEEKLSLLQRYKLRQLVESEKVRKRVQHFNEFIKKFPECDANPETVYEQVVEQIGKKVVE